MASDRKRVQIQYRKLDDPEGYFGQMSLQEAIVQALNVDRSGGPMRGHVNRREQDDDPAYGTVGLNEMGEDDAHFFGELVRFEKGAQLTLLKTGGGGQKYNLVNAKAPEDHEPLKGVLYFMVFGNHVTLLPGEIAPGRLERYLRWLLAEASLVIRKAANVVLAAEIEVTEGSEPIPLIQRVTYNPQPFQALDFDQGDIALVSKAERQQVASQNTVQVLRAAGVDDTDINRLMSEKTDVAVTLEISFKNGSRSKPLAAGTVGRMFRNVDPDELTFSGPRGARQKGRLVRFTYPANVLTVGSLLDWQDAARKLHDAYTYFVANGHIQP